ncbi:MAG TPA: L-rhamnose mutarotase [Pseudonocardia sp.]|jgi:L-rhamnose mutarotase|nr:L-rhamnose mutarotase [Pseudonocardia sp.]
MPSRRYGSVIRLRPEHEATYRELHAAVWPDVLAQIARSNIRNYTIFLRDGLLFAYFEYTGTDLDADLTAMAADQRTQQWWKLTDPCQQAVPSAEEGQWWAPLEEVFHTD